MLSLDWHVLAAISAGLMPIRERESDKGQCRGAKYACPELCAATRHSLYTYREEGSNKPYPSTAQKLTCCLAACYKFSTIRTIRFSTVCPSPSDPPIMWRIPNLNEGYNMLFGSKTSHQHCRTAGEKVTAQRPDRFFNIPLDQLMNWPIGQYQIETVSNTQAAFKNRLRLQLKIERNKKRALYKVHSWCGIIFKGFVQFFPLVDSLNIIYVSVIFHKWNNFHRIKSVLSLWRFLKLNNIQEIWSVLFLKFHIYVI